MFKRLLALFVVSILLNFPWEVAQMPLYVEEGSWFEFARHCFIPSIGDGFIVLLIFCVGWIARGQSDWSDQPGWTGYAVMLAAGLIIAVMVEWTAMSGLGRWSYTSSMPVLPVLGVGVVPVVQMLVLPPVIFKITGWWLKRQLRV